MIRTSLMKPHISDDMDDLIKSGAPTLLKIIYHFFEFEQHIVPLSSMPRRLLRIDLIKATIQEGVHHIYLKHWSLVVDCRRKHGIIELRRAT